MKPPSLPQLSMTVSRHCWASKSAMGEVNEKNASPFGSEPTGGRYLLGAIFVIALILLTLIGDQTTPGSTGQTEMSGGWWAEPAVAPAVALTLTIVAAALAAVSSRWEKVDFRGAVSVYGRAFGVAGSMIVAVMLMKVLGFALSILIFAFCVTFMAGFRGVRLAIIPIGTTIAMVLIFRVGFAIWFPRPMLFKWIDIPIKLQGLL